MPNETNVEHPHPGSDGFRFARKIKRGPEGELVVGAERGGGGRRRRASSCQSKAPKVKLSRVKKNMCYMCPFFLMYAV